MTAAKAKASQIVLETTDLREITRNPELCLTEVYVQTGRDIQSRIKWLICGQSKLIPQRDHRDGRWRLEAYLPDGVTDFEHDSGYAFKLPLIGVEFEMVDYHQATFHGWVDPNNDHEDFRVPRPGYNPMKHPKARKCEPSKYCPGNHMIVPEGFWAGPPTDTELWKAVQGKKVQICIGPVYPKEEDE
jgi:hypothetical protein